MSNLKNTCQEFQDKIAAISKAGGVPTAKVYSLWRKYQQRCDWSDQSAILWEFVQWYEEELGAHVQDLREAMAKVDAERIRKETNKP
jgi:hypothetical protein